MGSTESMCLKQEKQMKTYNFYSDAGHGWLEVDLQELVSLGVASAISRYSYIKQTENGIKVYLEEDCDTQVFHGAMAKSGIEYSVTGIDHGWNSPIRNYRRFGE
jgi:hypothetical protein